MHLQVMFKQSCLCLAAILIGQLPLSAQSDTATIGTGIDTSAVLPLNSCASFNYSQQLYLANAYDGDAYITHIQFKYLGGADDAATWSTWTMYLGNTAKTVFADSTDWVPVDALQQVFSGTIAPVADAWMDLALDVPFAWDGTSNIVVAILENGAGSSCSATWSAFQSGAGRGLRATSEVTPIDPVAPGVADQAPDSTIAQVRFISTDEAPCNSLPAPGATLGPDSICPGIPFLLTLEEETEGSGVSFQWQRSADSLTWTDVPGDGTAAEYWASLDSATWYRALVSCASMGSTASTPLHVQESAFGTCYCAVTFTVQVEPICHVTFAGIDNSSPGEVDDAPEVEDFTALPPAELIAGNAYPMQVTGNTNGNFTDRITAFFDWDHDGIFEASVPLSPLTNSVCTAAATGTANVPADALAGISRMRVVKNGGPAPDDPCGEYSYGQAEDYLVNVTVPMPCDALPAPGATLGPDSICADVPFTLSVENPPTGAGITFQWEQSTDSLTWTEAPGNSTSAEYTTTQTTATWYRAQVTCTGTGTAASEAIHVDMLPATDCYCDSLSFSYQVQPICHVGFAGIDNASSGTSALEDFTGLAPAQLVTGFSYPLTLRGYSDFTTSQAVAFFDWDRDGVFESVIPLGSLVNDSCSTELEASITVPTDAAPGLSHMRVLLADFQIPTDPCGSFVSGQGEDYSINVSEAVACNGLPTPGNTLGPDSICAAVPFTLDLEQVQQETGISYQWESSADGLTWDPAPGNSNGPSFTTSLTDTTWFRAAVTCAGSGTAYSTEHRVALAPAAECYCTGVGFSAMVQPICHVAFADLENASDGTLNGSPGFEDFSDLTATVVRTNSYPLSVAGNANGGSGFVSAFFDWDGNGVYETEANIGVIGGTECADTIFLPITVPAAAALGHFHFRVVMNANNYATDPCALYTMGQAEEYGLEVTPVSTITESQDGLALQVHPNPAHSVLFIEAPPNSDLDLRVIDMPGHLLMSVRPGARQLDVSSLAPGSYVIFALERTTGRTAHVRFVKW
jgi:hypothetical protein